MSKTDPVALALSPCRAMDPARAEYRERERPRPLTGFLPVVAAKSLLLALGVMLLPFLTAAETPSAASPHGSASAPSTAADSPTTPSSEASRRAATADPAAWLFAQSCAECHGFAPGSKKGFDLRPATESPREDLAVAVKHMEKETGPLTSADVQGLTDLLKDPRVCQRVAAAERAKEEGSAAPESAAPAETGSSRNGNALFHGKLAFANRGMACAACHKVNDRGGTVGPDLTHAATRLGPEGLLKAIEHPESTVMAGSYKNAPLTHQEAVDLAAWLAEADRTTAADGKTQSPASR